MPKGYCPSKTFEEVSRLGERTIVQKVLSNWMDCGLCQDDAGQERLTIVYQCRERREQRAWGRDQKTELRRQNSEVRRQKAKRIEVRIQKSVAPGEVWSVGIGGERATF